MIYPSGTGIDRNKDYIYKIKKLIFKSLKNFYFIVLWISCSICLYQVGAVVPKGIANILRTYAAVQKYS